MTCPRCGKIARIASNLSLFRDRTNLVPVERESSSFKDRDRRLTTVPKKTTKSFKVQLAEARQKDFGRAFSHIWELSVGGHRPRLLGSDPSAFVLEGRAHSL